MLVVGGVQMPAQFVRRGPEFGFQALAGGVFGFGFLGWSARHGVLFIAYGDVIARKAKIVRAVSRRSPSSATRDTRGLADPWAWPAPAQD